MPSPSEGGHGHDVGWHIWPICILELKIFGSHSIVFSLQNFFVKFQMAHRMQQKSLKSMKVWVRYAFSKWRGSWACGLFSLWTSLYSFCFFVYGLLKNIVNFHSIHLWSWNVFQKDKKLQKYGKGLVIGIFNLSISYVILT